MEKDSIKKGYILSITRDYSKIKGDTLLDKKTRIYVNRCILQDKLNEPLHVYLYIRHVSFSGNIDINGIYEDMYVTSKNKNGKPNYLFTIVHDDVLYVSTSVKKLNKHIKSDCGCEI